MPPVATPHEPARILWIMRSPVFVRNFEAVLVELARRGHAVHVAFEGEKEGQDIQQRRLIAELVDAHPQITVGRAPLPTRVRAVLTSRLRGIADYLRYLEPEFADAHALRARARRGAPCGIRVLEGPLRRSAAARRALARGGRALARLPPIPWRILRYVSARRPDVLLVSPLTHFGSPQPDYLRAARRLGLPSALVLFSWDNLTTKSVIHEIPDRVLVWNEQQAREAVEHHGVAPARIEVTGAASYDHWFRWRPSCDRRAFLSALGLDPERACLLYVCSSGFIAPDEPAWIAEWLDAVRATPGPLSQVNVIVRPHPLNASGWERDPLGGRPGVRVFPTGGEDPTHETARRSYFDSIHHAELVVGINTTAIVESAIIGRRCYTLRTERFAETQEGTLHFHQLTEPNGGPLRLAGSMDEHLAQLSEGLAGRPDDVEQLGGFVHRFVRPLGLDRDVAPVIADRIEALSCASTPRATTLRPGTGPETGG